MTSILKQAFIDYAIRNGDSREVAVDKVNYAIQHCPYGGFDYHKTTAYIDDLKLCVVCLEVNHEDNLQDLNGQGLTCFDCKR